MGLRTRVAAMVAAGSAALASPGAAAAPCAVNQIAELPVTMRGLQPTVPLTINGQAERFLLDSGAFFSAITPGKARELDLKLQDLPAGYYISGVGGEVVPRLAYVDKVGLVGVELKHIPFIVGGSEVGAGAGIVGQNVLGLADVEYDLAHGAVRLLRPKDCGRSMLSYWAAAANQTVSVVELEPTDTVKRHTVGTVTLNGIRMRAIFDTGADSTVLSMGAAARLGFKPGNKDMVFTGVGGGIGSRSVNQYNIPVASIKIGDNEEVRNTHLDVTALGMDIDLLIGVDFFLSHRVYVSNEQRRLYFTYEGGPIFGKTAGVHVDPNGMVIATPASQASDPTDAAGFSRRGAAALSRHNDDAALADFDRAVAMEPKNALYHYQRGEARAAKHEGAGALADLDAAVDIDPDYAEARLARARLRIARGNRAGAADDVAAVTAKAAPAADIRIQLGALLDTLERPADAIDQYDLWLRFHPDDRRKPIAQNGRCWARGLLGVELAKALSDCDAAIRTRPGTAAFLDSRALVRLRMGDAAAAIRDYDAALAVDPDAAWSLYCRGLAKARAGDKAGSDKDIAAAIAHDKGVAARAKAFGLTT